MRKQLCQLACVRVVRNRGRHTGINLRHRKRLQLAQMSTRWALLRFYNANLTNATGKNKFKARVDALLREGFLVWAVCSEAPGAHSHLSSAIEAAEHGAAEDQYGQSLSQFFAIQNNFYDGKSASPAYTSLVDSTTTELSRLLAGVSMLRESSARTQAKILSFSEYLGARALHDWLSTELDVPVEFVDARDVLEADGDNPLAGALMDGHGAHFIKPMEEITARLDGSRVVVTQGNTARLRTTGDTCRLGSHGSDTAACLLAESLGAERIELWHTAHGLYVDFVEPMLCASAAGTWRLWLSRPREIPPDRFTWNQKNGTKRWG